MKDHKRAWLSVKVNVWIGVLLGIAFMVCYEEVLFEDVIGMCC